jgi:hypothetical protein
MTSEPVVVTGTSETSTYHISWGAVFGGAVVALGLWILLHTLGLAVGLTAIDPDKPHSLRGVGIGTGIWSIIAPLIALFSGGLVASRTAGVIDRGTGALHGAVMWGLTTVGGVLLLAVAVTSVVTGAARLSQRVLGAAMPVAQGLKLDADDVLGPINDRLQQEGKAPVTSAQIEAATHDVVGNALRGAPVDREALVGAIASNTSLDRADAEQVAGRAQAQIAKAAVAARHGALQAAEMTGKVLWAVFFAVLLGLISAVAGGLVGVSRRQRAALVGPVAPEPLPPIERRVPVTTAP